MQIHELTQPRRQRTDEAGGLLQNFKDAVSAAKTGYAAGKAGTGSTLGAAGTALGTFGKAITSPGFAAQSDKDANKDAAMAKYKALKDKYGWSDPGDEPTGQSATATAQSQQAVQQQAKAMTQQFAQSLNEPELADLTAVLPDPGKVLVVRPQTGGVAYKDASGKWMVNTENGMIPARPEGIKAYEAMIDQDQYTQESPPAGMSESTQSVSPAQQVKEATNPRAMKVSSIVNRIIKQNKNAEQKALKATIDQAKADPKAKANIDRAYQQVLNATALTASKAKTRAAKKTAVVKAFSNYANTALTQAAQIGQGQESTAPAGDQATAQQGASATNPVIQQAAANKLAVQGLDKQTIDKVKEVAKKDPNSVKQALGLAEYSKPLSQRLKEALQILSEAQVAITKDIIIRTAKGNYVKSAQDQQWRDPNGVVIDPVKYADYIKKLDATPMAQTQYQADARKAGQGKGPGGTDTGAQKAAQTPPPPPPPQAQQPASAPPPDPVAQMAHQQAIQNFLRTRDVNSLNAQIKDTTTQLRNAQIFGTGQEQYLQQQLAQLIAMKV